MKCEYKQEIRIYINVLCVLTPVHQIHMKAFYGKKKLRLVFASTQISAIICTPNNALSYYQKYLKQNRLKILFFEKTSKNISEITKVYVTTKYNW